jgi:plastocyanin
MRLTVALVLLGVAHSAAAATLLVELRDAHGAPVAEAVVYAVPETKRLASAPRPAVLDQKNRMFVPHVLPIQTGTAVTFPNSDNVRHQVYSFSSAKKFQLPLYAGTPAVPVVFDRPGVVAIGCNIHDQMSAFLVVVDTPYFAAMAGGRAALSSLPEGKYDVRVWYTGMRNEPAPQPVSLTASEEKSLTFDLRTK